MSEWMRAQDGNRTWAAGRIAATAVVVGSLAIAILGTQPTMAADLRYCLARSTPLHKVYMSPAFSSDEAIDELEAAFGHALDRARIPHEPVQCPRGDADSIDAMKQQAIGYGHIDGLTAVEFKWKPVKLPSS